MFRGRKRNRTNGCSTTKRGDDDKFIVGPPCYRSGRYRCGGREVPAIRNNNKEPAEIRDNWELEVIVQIQVHDLLFFKRNRFLRGASNLNK